MIIDAALSSDRLRRNGNGFGLLASLRAKSESPVQNREVTQHVFAWLMVGPTTKGDMP